MTLRLHKTGIEFPDGSWQRTAGNGLPYRNLIINGDMRIAQRGTSKTGITSAGYYTVDRWRIGLGGSYEFTMSQDTDVPSGQGFGSSLKLACTTANASPSAGDQFHVGTRFEGQNLQHLKYGTASAEKLTLSFWVKSNKTGTLTVRGYQHDPTTKRSLSQFYTINSADTWEKKTLTFNGDTDSDSVFDNDNAISMQLDWFMSFGSNYTSGTDSDDWRDYDAANDGSSHTVNLADSTSNYINITGVQLEVGDTATPFEHRPYDVELARCQRYYWEGDRGSVLGKSYTDGNVSMDVCAVSPVPLRGTPTVTWESGGTDWRGAGTNFVAVKIPTAIVIDGAGTHIKWKQEYSSGSLLPNHVWHLAGNPKLYIEAEL